MRGFILEPNELVPLFDVRARELGYTGDKLGCPDVSADAEEKSFFLHAEIRSRIPEPEVSGQELERVVFLSEQLCSGAQWRLRPYRNLSAVERAIESIDLRCSPGLPWIPDIKTNEDFFSDEGRPQQVLDNWDNQDDIIRLFVKREPTKVSKLEEGRVRLISSVSILPQVRGHCLFDASNDAYTRSWTDTPIKYGFSRGGGHASLFARCFQNRGTKVLMADKSSWDWGMPWWVVKASHQLRSRLCVHDDPELFEAWKRDSWQEYRNLYESPLLQLSNGRRFRQTTPGLQKSGAVVTISLNSEAQLFLHILALIRMGYSNADILSPQFTFGAGGDDTIQNIPVSWDEKVIDRYLRITAELGSKVKEYKVTDSMEGAEFFSAEFRQVQGQHWSCDPMNFEKTWTNLRNIGLDDLGASLQSAMISTATEPKRQSLFRSIYLKLHDACPYSAPLKHLKSPEFLRCWDLGWERGGC